MLIQKKKSKSRKKEAVIPKSRLRNFYCSEVTYNNLAWLAQQDMVSVANKINLAAKQLVESEAAAKGIAVADIPWILDAEGRVTNG